MAYETVNPTTGEKIKSFPEVSIDEMNQIVEQTHLAFTCWKETPFTERSELLKKAASLLRKNAKKYADLMVLEMGKPIKQAHAEVEKCAFVCEYYADNAASFLSPENIPTDAQKSYVAYEPIGIVFAIMPWNFPFWQVFRFLAPALMAGNAGLLKHAVNVPQCAIAIEEIIQEAGFPKNIFRNLLMNVEKSNLLIENPLVKAVTLTGSTRAGKEVAAKAGAYLKKCVLELGGSDPYIILEDADIESAVTTCVTSRMINSGQSCVAAKRFIVVEKVKKQFEELYVAQMKKKTLGDPTKEETEVGPMARLDLRDELHKQVQKSISDGATLLLGGEIPDRPGAFYPPTVLTDVKKGMCAYEEELFGPVASIIPVKDETEALEVANDNIYGLGGAVFTKDIKKGQLIAEKKIDSGCCFVNSFVKSDPRLPFGGIKESGYGRELSYFGIREFVNIKTVYVA